MPAIIDSYTCDNSPGCAARRVCKKSAIKFDRATQRMKIDHKLCGDCKGLCMRGCDRMAIKYAPSGDMFNSLLMQYGGEDIMSGS